MDYEEQEECSSGCDSGWTVYLEQSSSGYFGRRQGNVECFRHPKRLKEDQEDDVDEEEEVEDLSMVSDASSGPPPVHFNEEEVEDGGAGAGWFHHMEKNRKRNSLAKRENRRLKVKDQSSLLDDTASSPFLDFSTKQKERRQEEHTLEYSQGFSSTQYQVMEAPYEKEYCDFLLSSPSGNQLQQDQGWFEGKNYW